jgi:hypothetical protein
MSNRNYVKVKVNAMNGAARMHDDTISFEDKAETGDLLLKSFSIVVY